MTRDPALAKAIRAAVKYLAARSLTRRELVGRLVKRGFDRTLADAAADDLGRQGLLNDRAAAQAAARRQIERGSAGTLAEDRLVSRGIDPVLARQAVSDATGDRDEASAALDLARKRVRACPPSLEPDSIRRRVFAFLARRGYDEETARSAVDRAVREIIPE